VATELRLRDGTPAIVWSLLPSDREALRDAYEHLSPESQLHRFLTPVPHLTWRGSATSWASTRFPDVSMKSQMIDILR
jgi:hypothetical protein